jgi:hypothetical protein
MTETLTYSQVGDYLLPNIRLNEPPREDAPPLGRYGRMRKQFLKEHRKITYSRLLLSEELFPHLRETDELATARLETVTSLLTARTQLPDKATDQLSWTAAMNTLKAQAEEMVANELIYAD